MSTKPIELTNFQMSNIKRSNIKKGLFSTGQTIAYLLCVFLSVSAAMLANAASKSTYHVEYKVSLQPKTRSANVEIVLGKRANYVRWIRFQIDPKFHTDFKGTGRIEKKDKTITWHPDSKGGSLFFTVKLNHRRKSGRYDALFTDEWAVFRGDDIIPPTRVDMEDGTRAKAKLRFELPKNWSVVTPYPRYKSGAYKIDHKHRLFDRPTGWMLAGEIGVKRETIDGVYVTVAAPKGQGVRRMDILAHLNWNLPGLIDVFPDFPARLLVISASDPMWRGALSGPSSLFVHADRPLISEDGTSPLLHEIIHVAMSARAAPNADWLVEGIAEYYSLEIMRRSGTITEKRYQKSLEQLAKRGESVSRLNVDQSHGAITAKAVGEIRALDAELRAGSNNKLSFDNIVRELATQSGKITVGSVRSIGKKLSGTELKWNPNVRGIRASERAF
jgi:M61 glycyl aminopeptidase